MVDANLLTPESVGLESKEFCFDVMNFSADFTEELLVHGRRLLGEGRQERLVDNILYVSFDKWCKIRGQNMGEVIGDVRAKEKLLNFHRKTLHGGISL
jgi:hypothetical protein